MVDRITPDGEPAFFGGRPTTLVGSQDIWRHHTDDGSQGVPVPDYRWIRWFFFSGFACPPCWLYVVIRVSRIWYIESRYQRNAIPDLELTLTNNTFNIGNNNPSCSDNNEYQNQTSIQEDGSDPFEDRPFKYYYFNPAQYKAALGYLSKTILAAVTYGFILFIIIYGLVEHSNFKSPTYFHGLRRG